MDAGGTIAGRRQLNVNEFLRACSVAISVVANVLLLGFACLVLTRRLSGGFAYPLSPLALGSVGVILVALSFAARYPHLTVGLQSGHALSLRLLRYVSFTLPSVAIAISAVAILLPTSSRHGVLALILILAIEESIWWYQFLRKRKHNSSASTRSATVIQSTKLRVDPPETPEPHALPQGISQRMERGLGEQDQDVCHGQVRCRFQEGQRTDTVHLAFCPPFPSTPELHLEQLDGPDAVIKPTQVLPYGARLEIRLAKPNSASVQTVIEFFAVLEA